MHCHRLQSGFHPIRRLAPTNFHLQMLPDGRCVLPQPRLHEPSVDRLEDGPEHFARSWFLAEHQWRLSVKCPSPASPLQVLPYPAFLEST